MDVKRIIAWLIVIPAALFVSSLLFGDPTVIEAENFTGFTDIARKTIRSLSSPACHGGKLLAGLDFPEEWATYEFSVDRAGDYWIDMLYRGDEDMLFRFKLTLSSADGGKSREFGFEFFGRGYG